MASKYTIFAKTACKMCAHLTCGCKIVCRLFQTHKKNSKALSSKHQNTYLCIHVISASWIFSANSLWHDSAQ